MDSYRQLHDTASGVQFEADSTVDGRYHLRLASPLAFLAVGLARGRTLPPSLVPMQPAIFATSVGTLDHHNAYRIGDVDTGHRAPMEGAKIERAERVPSILLVSGALIRRHPAQWTLHR